MKVERDRSNNQLKINQSQYVNKILDKFGMTDCNVVTTPLDQSQIANSDSQCVDVPYQQLIGSIMYLAVCTRPDISYAVSYLSQFNNQHLKEHWLKAKRVLKYLKGTKELGILYKKTGKSLCGFVDSDWANNVNDRKSFSGFVFTLAGGPIS